MNGRALFLAILEVIPLVGPLAFAALFTAAYLTPASAIPTFVEVLVATVLTTLAITPIMCGLGWFVSGRWTVAIAILLVRVMTLLALAHALVATDGEGCSNVGVRAACTEVYATAALVIAIPLASLVALSMLELRLSRE